jgi:hypothetical protein
MKPESLDTENIHTPYYLEYYAGENKELQYQNRN